MTKELISEALRWANGHPNRRSSELMRALADALEAQTGVRVDMGSAVGVETQLGARQPTEDDRYAAETILRTLKWVDGKQIDAFIHPSLVGTAAKALIDAGFSRAAVPDAATEETCAERMERKHGALAHLRDVLKTAEAERDAALAALERIREAVSGHPECARYEEGDVISCGWKSAYASVVAALDGAPELEWEHALFMTESDGSLAITAWKPDEFEHARKAWPDVEFIEMRRIKAPWLPVEGENK